jgi:thioredoxin 1
MASENVLHVKDQTFKNEVLEASEPVLVDFWAAWCGPCKMIAPVIDELAEDYKGKVKICKLNVDENGQTAQEYGVMSIPTMILYKNGKEIDRLVGFMPKASIAQKLEKAI